MRNGKHKMLYDRKPRRRLGLFNNTLLKLGLVSPLGHLSIECQLEAYRARQRLWWDLKKRPAVYLSAGERCRE